jgi:hypothetical protein
MVWKFFAPLMIHEPSGCSTAGAEGDILRRLGEVVEAEIGVRLVIGDGGEVGVVLDETSEGSRPLLVRHADLEPVARAPRRQHEVVGGADVAGGEFLRDEARGQMVGEAGAAVFLR